MSNAAIIEAAQNLDLKRSRDLLEERPELLTATDRRARNLLHIACSVSTEALDAPRVVQVRFADFLLDRGFEIDLPVGRDAATPLFFAVARARNPALVKRLIQRGARPAAAPGGCLFAAGWWEDIEILKLLIGAGARVDVVVGITPFLACWCWRRFEAAKFLAKSGADVDHSDSKGRTALHHGVEKGFDPSLLQWLVRHGASPDIADEHGVTARQRAARKRDERWLTALE